ncbi:winged helix-turn-helix domain-containing protein [Rheinheimera baltica]|uniref:winged helix-turn-helix domain-containing protein n=2 Tax=Rheinheimera baltica TaxID=67576 RepID=UPI00273FCF79|nr:winged helix-turn-helix domain-containing protein [Rheinheimera baltica]MDP5151887.1 winged helix-turn-helix domain-containing protein [Rheinheimera baltica]
MKIVDLGDFTVDTQARRLYRQSEELAAEPKVIEVLCYFIQHADRFVSLQELHQQVWQGRVVTDTAVRRTISKLRTLLGDNDTEQPKYIRSQMKRGYQLVCPALPGEESAVQSHAAVETNAAKKNKLIQSHWLKQLVAGSVVSALVLVVAFVLLASPVHLHTDYLQVELDIPGQKASLALSPDGHYQAFVGRVNSGDKWQLYLHNRQKGQLAKVSTPVPHVRFVDFVANGAAMAYVGFRQNVAELYIQPVADLAAKPQQYVLPGLSILAGPLALPNNQMLIAGGESYNGNIHYYQLDISTGQYSQFSFSSAASVQDAYARLSPDKRQIALIRANIAEQKLYLQIYRLADRELLVEQQLSDKLIDMRLAWLANNALLIRQKNQFVWFDIDKGQLNALDIPAENIREFIPDQNGRLVAIYRKPTEQHLFRTSWPYNDGFSEHLQLNTQVQSVQFSHDSSYYWLTEQVGSYYQLSRYFKDTAKKQLVMQSEAPFTLLDQSAPSLLLIKRLNRLELMDTSNGDIVHLSLSTQLVDQGVFSPDGQSVLFAAASGGQWQILQYNLRQATQQVVLNEYRYLQPYNNGYVAASVDGSLWLLDNNMQPLTSLYQGIHFDLDYHIALRGDDLNVLHRNLMSDWELVSINLKTNDKWQRKLTYSEFSAQYSLDPTGKELLFFKPKVDNNHVVSFGYNFGYNSLL